MAGVASLTMIKGEGEAPVVVATIGVRVTGRKDIDGH